MEVVNPFYEDTRNRYATEFEAAVESLRRALSMAVAPWLARRLGPRTGWALALVPVGAVLAIAGAAALAAPTTVLGAQGLDRVSGHIDRD